MKVLYTRVVTNVIELERVIYAIKQHATDTIPDQIYITDSNGKDAVFQLIENTLSDGSKTYDVRVS